MAKTKLGPTVIGIRGTAAGLTFSANRGGTYLRGWHKPPNTRTGLQLAQRNKLSQWAVQWRALTAVQKTSWNTYAAAAAQALTDSLGQTYYASGYNWYQTTQQNLALLGLAATTTAPAGARLAAPVVENFIFRDTPAVGTTRFQYGVADPNLAVTKAIYAVIVNSQGINVEPANLFFMKIGTPNGSRQISIQTELETRFGDCKLGQRCFAYTYNINTDGQASLATHASANAQNP